MTIASTLKRLFSLLVERTDLTFENQFYFVLPCSFVSCIMGSWREHTACARAGPGRRGSRGCMRNLDTTKTEDLSRRRRRRLHTSAAHSCSDVYCKNSDIVGGRTPKTTKRDISTLSYILFRKTEDFSALSLLSNRLSKKPVHQSQVE